MKNEILAHIGKGDLHKAISTLKVIEGRSEYQMQIISFASRLSDLQEREIARTINFEEREILRNRLVEDLMQFLEIIFAIPICFVAEPPRKLTIIKEGDFHALTEEAKLRILELIRQVLDMPGDITLDGVSIGSIQFHLRLPADAALRLLQMVKNGQLKKWGIVDAHFPIEEAVQRAKDQIRTLARITLQDFSVVVLDDLLNRYFEAENDYENGKLSLQDFSNVLDMYEIVYDALLRAYKNGEDMNAISKNAKRRQDATLNASSPFETSGFQ